MLAIALAAVSLADGTSAQTRPAVVPPPLLPAAPATAATAASANTTPVAGAVRELNLTQLGIDYAIQLRGISGTVGIPFNVRADELVTAASFRLNYAYSPSLIPELSHLKVTVNDVLVATLPVSHAEAGKPQTADIPIDRRLITEFNRINVELIGHYTRECEDPAHTSLWARVDASSTLKLTVSPLKLTNDLAALPQPFFDRRDVRRARIPFVFGGADTAPMLEAAGVLSSWFGALADYRGATFPVSHGELPAGHAVVFVTPESAIAGLTLPSIQGPGLAVVDNPQDASGKLLLVMGRNPADLRTAAAALALNSKAFAGAQAAVTAFQEPPVRKPYDAPRWVPSDRALQLGELATAADLSVTGYNPDVVRVNLQLPPDLFTWRSRGIPLDLQYRYTPRVRPDQSTLNINVNDNFVGGLPLRSANPAGDRWWNPLAVKLMPDGTLAEHKEVILPPLAMGPRSQLRLHYYFEPVGGRCVPQLDNVRGSIDPTSKIDVSGFPHFIAMPELAAYANGGFPFSRMADLSDTAVILPDQPNDADTETYLGLLGQIGRSTGYPALRVKVGRSAEAGQWADKDLLVIGNLQSQSLFTQWADKMPLKRNGNAPELKLRSWIDNAIDLVIGARTREDLPGSMQIAVSDDGRDAVLAGFESPLRSGRSVIAAITNADSKEALLNALMTPDLLKRVQGSMTIVRDTQVNSVLGGDTYYVGRLPPLTWLQWHLSRSPLGLAALVIVLALLGAAVSYAGLQIRARRRLSVNKAK
ncbi:cellulose biosynthesis cyclic di-GMP-binding regulatory protein BcsB [Variovorax sp. PDNC026]|uniref:cellulose biosynthesis cyclic di-GMP-binding regulatory protein BcsB n=2 Tax=unclassified Variovorax TaxID=663243 RepID=UPI000D1220F6|nr:cellulose biosynthesis cyclic di-GMP-binding regulatory protein BcsB [Variovorax sp. PDNC026]AVQ80262.1 cellulose synthase [Variovorax sp. PMC12]QRY30330.1 cellulose biosynthesis cyclic di-GMP-binding regulatory protein BcsB [Variovorax sp. PDNC026]